MHRKSVYFLSKKYVSMCVVFEPQKCAQCGSHSSSFTQDHRSGGYETACGRCGSRERHESLLDDEGFYRGFRHEASQGFGVLFYRLVGGHEFYSHLLNTPRETIDAERWLRERLDTGIIDPQTACLTRWDDETNQVEVVVGELVDVLAGKIVTMSGVPGDGVHGGRSTASPALR